MSDSANTQIGILVLEDSPADSRLLQESLRDRINSGEVVMQVVRKLADAVRELQRFKFSCILVDLGIPDGEGVSNVSRVREVDKDVAIVVLTGLRDLKAAEEAAKLGAHDYLIKGERTGEELLDFVKQAIRKAGGTGSAGATSRERSAGLAFQPWVHLARRTFAGVHVKLNGDASEIRQIFDEASQWKSSQIRGAPLSISASPSMLSGLVEQLSGNGAELTDLSVRLECAELSISPALLDNLQTLRAKRTRIWVEGWKLGCAPLDLLSSIPLDGLVIDPSVTSVICSGNRDVALAFVRSTLAIGSALRSEVLADGVDFAEQHELLTTIGCDLAQGSWYGGACPANSFAELWRNGPTGMHRQSS